MHEKLSLISRNKENLRIYFHSLLEEKPVESGYEVNKTRMTEIISRILALSKNTDTATIPKEFIGVRDFGLTEKISYFYYCKQILTIGISHKQVNNYFLRLVLINS